MTEQELAAIEATLARDATWHPSLADVPKLIAEVRRLQVKLAHYEATITKQNAEYEVVKKQIEDGCEEATAKVNRILGTLTELISITGAENADEAIEEVRRLVEFHDTLEEVRIANLSK